MSREEPWPSINAYLACKRFLSNQTREGWELLKKELRPYMLTQAEKCGPKLLAAMEEAVKDGRLDHSDCNWDQAVGVKLVAAFEEARA